CKRRTGRKPRETGSRCGSCAGHRDACAPESTSTMLVEIHEIARCFAVGHQDRVAGWPPGFQSRGMRPGARSRSADDVLRLLAEQAAEIAALKSELSERREQLRAVIDNNPCPTWVYSLESLRFLEVNGVARELYG